jgi:hypothetical protein
VPESGLPDTSPEGVQAATSYMLVAGLSIMIDVSFLAFLYRISDRRSFKFISSGWLAVIIFVNKFSAGLLLGKKVH